MLYTKAAKVIAGLIIVSGVISISNALFAIAGVGDPEIWRRTGVSAKSIDFGLYCIVVGVVLGVLAEISQSLADIAGGRK
jgi:hypothetical protein